MAILYYDCLVVEKYWVNRIKQMKLDKKYNCFVSENLNELKSFLSNSWLHLCTDSCITMIDIVSS